MSEDEEFMLLDEAAKSLGMTRATIYNYMNDLNIKTQRLGRDKRSYLSREQINRIREYKEKPWTAKGRKETNKPEESVA